MPNTDPNVTNPILRRGEIIVDPLTGGTKTGDGKRHWLDLPFDQRSGGVGPPGPIGPAGPQGPKGDKGDQGDPGGGGGGGGTIPNTTNVLIGDGAGNADDSGIDPSDIAFHSEIPVVSDVAYNATTWNANLDAPTKNAVRDKFETLGAGGDALKADNLDQFADVTQGAGKVLTISNSTTLNGGTMNGGTHSGTNTGDQTSVTGNAGTATALQNSRTINAVGFNGTANITITVSVGSGVTGLGANVAALLATDSTAVNFSEFALTASLGSLAFNDSVAFADLTGLLDFDQIDRTATIISEPTGVLTLSANSKSATTLTGDMTEIAFSGGASPAQARALQLTVSGGPHSLIIPTCIRLGDDGSTIALLNIPDGVHWLIWEFDGTNYILADSIEDADVLVSGGPLGTPSSGNASNITADGTNLIGYRGAPQNSKSAAYTTVLADAGKCIFHPSSDNNARTFTIAANGSVAYPIGTIIEFLNMAVTASTIAITSDTMTLLPAGTTGSRTLARYGRANAEKIAATEWVISGNSALT